MSHSHVSLVAVERECVCPDGPNEPGNHIDDCEAQYRKRFFDAWAKARTDFYGPDQDISIN